MPRGSWQCLTNFQHLPPAQLNLSYSLITEVENKAILDAKKISYQLQIVSTSMIIMIVGRIINLQTWHLKTGSSRYEVPSSYPQLAPISDFPHPQLCTADRLQAPFQQSKSRPSFVHGGKQLDMDGVHNKHPERYVKYQKTKEQIKPSLQIMKKLWVA